SRRRHTSFSRDWSSDVCSSDLWTVSADRWTSNIRLWRTTLVPVFFKRILRNLLRRSRRGDRNVSRHPAREGGWTGTLDPPEGLGPRTSRGDIAGGNTETGASTGASPSSRRPKGPLAL